jgi:Flp pilus assembly pilin Flp
MSLTMKEYAVVATMIAIIAISLATQIGNSINAVFERIAVAL